MTLHGNCGRTHFKLPKSSRWVAVELSGGSGPGSALAVVLLSGRRIEVKRGFDAHTLEQLVRLLEQV